MTRVLPNQSKSSSRVARKQLLGNLQVACELLWSVLGFGRAASTKTGSAVLCR
ncbi:hypothetical protein [Synechococcus sp. HBA1120]|uniref:hypothetical protein n=1 Tax=Synechococcus sp. HBA1120 TaxID=2508341 RepID=UPI001CF886A5|nr:hypothetical protein [Synechococcus sp. HBA1120]